jgi:hypothetical protein
MSLVLYKNSQEQGQNDIAVPQTAMFKSSVQRKGE